MKDTLINIVIFAVGAAVGSAVTWKYFKTKYERIAQEEIDSVKEVFSKRKKELEEDKNTYEPTADDLHDYASVIKGSGYSTQSVEEMENMSKPYVIPPEDFGEIDEYETVSFTYYSDGILADDMDDIVEDVDNTVGYDSLKHFGEYEDDSVFVRNDRLKTDYEILLDTRAYSDLNGG